MTKDILHLSAQSAPRADPERLASPVVRRGSEIGLPTWGGFLVGATFVAAGSVIVLISIGTIPVVLEGPAPLWVLTVFGVLLVIGATHAIIEPCQIPKIRTAPLRRISSFRPRTSN